MLQAKRLGPLWTKPIPFISSDLLIDEIPKWDTSLEEVVEEITMTGGLVGAFSSEHTN